MLTSTTRSVLFAGLFVLGLGLGLVIFLPLPVVAQQIQSAVPQINIQSTNGTWWQGSFNQVRWQQNQPADLHWQLLWRSLLSGQIAAQVDIAQPTLQAEARIHWPNHNNQHAARQTLGVTSGQVNLDIARITPYAPYPLPTISGQLAVFVEHMTLDLPGLQELPVNNSAKLLSAALNSVSLDSPGRFSASKLVILDNLSLGSLAGQITRSSEARGYHIALQESIGPLAIRGHSLLTDQQISSDYRIVPNKNADPRLIKLLDLMGKKTKPGHYHVKTVYNL